MIILEFQYSEKNFNRGFRVSPSCLTYEVASPACKMAFNVLWQALFFPVVADLEQSQLIEGLSLMETTTIFDMYFLWRFQVSKLSDAICYWPHLVKS